MSSGNFAFNTDFDFISKYVSVSETETRAIGGYTDIRANTNLIDAKVTLGDQEVDGHKYDGYFYNYYESLATLLGINYDVSINYLSSICSFDANIDIDTSVDTDGDGINDSNDPNISFTMSGRTFSLYTYFDPKISFDDEFECNTFITEDIAKIIRNAYFIIEMLGLAILVLLSSMDYLKVFLNDNSDELKKANSNFAKRLGIVVVLFLLPALLNVILNVFKIEGMNSENPLCVKISNK